MSALERDPSPAELRRRLGENLRTLSSSAVSISALCRDLGINRTQFNRYRAGESFPRPDVLWRICRHFRVDARILLEPVDALAAMATGPFCHSEMAGFLAAPEAHFDETTLPSGLYRVARADGLDDGEALTGLLRIYRKDGHSFVRGFAPALAGSRHDDIRMREYRGVLIPQGAGFSTITTRRMGNALTCSDMGPVADMPGLWAGTATLRAARPGRPLSLRQVMTFLGSDTRAVMSAARAVGMVRLSSLPEPMRAHLA